MSRIAFLFPGQGAQQVGMGRELYQQSEPTRQLFHHASEVLGDDLVQVIFDGPAEQLAETRYCQPAILVTSLAYYAELQRRRPDLEPGAVAGLSLGEYTALVVAGVLTLEDALPLVVKRGELMQVCCDQVPSGMVSVLRSERQPVAEVVEALQQEGHVIAISNHNGPDQTVISGEQAALELAMERLHGLGLPRLRCIPLTVAGAYHSPLMQTASGGLRDALADVPMQAPAVPFVSNVTGQVVSDPETIRRQLVEQVVSTVRWEETMELLKTMGLRQFIELGPGNVLSGLIRRFDRGLDAASIGHLDEMESV